MGYTSRPPCAYMADAGTAVPLHCEGDKGSGIHLGTRRCRSGTALRSMFHFSL
jgi:hypothetical protein